MNDVFDLMDEWGPEKVVCVADQRTGMQGVIVIDNTARGMGKGGTRMSPTVSVEEIARLARTMTWKWTAADLFFGGAKAGIRADPTAKSKEAVLRAWARALAKHIPSEYVAGLDMGMNERDSGIIKDELEDRGAAVGTPAVLGGVPYDKLGFTGYGVAEAAAEAAEIAELTLSGATVSIQGFGAVGAAAAKRFAELGSVVVAISTSAGAIADDDGLDVPRLLELREAHGDALVHEYDGARTLGAGEELTLPVDVLVPAACQDVIDAGVALELRAKVVVEGANLPTDAPAQELLRERGVTVVPDFVANAGAAVCTGVAMDERRSAFAPDTDAMYAVVKSKLRANTRTVLERAQADGVTTRQAALELTQQRVREAMEIKGRIRRTEP